MTGRDSRCTVCKHERRDDVDAQLLGGTRPADVFRNLAEGLELSRAATFRHAARHLPTTLGPRWVDGESSIGDVILDLGNLRRGLIEDRETYRRRGNSTAANAAAQRLESVSLALLRDMGIRLADAETNAAVLSMVGAALRVAAQEFPAVIQLMVTILRGFDVRDELREERDSIAAELLEMTPDPDRTKE